MTSKYFFKINSYKKIRTFIALLFGFFIVVLMSVFFIWRQKNTNVNVGRGINVACTTENDFVVAQAIGYVNLNNAEQLYKSAEDIKGFIDYDKDQNCLAILVFTAVSRGDISEAESKVVAIKKVYQPGVDRGAGNVFTSNPEKLSEIVDLLKSNFTKRKEAQDKFNAIGFDDGIQD